jgi:hypothetical protein
MRSVRNVPRSNEAGFVLTLELIVLVSIFGVVAIYALVLIQQHFLQQVADDFGHAVVIYDSKMPMGSSVRIGRATSFNALEAPQVIYRVATPSPPLAALLSVRATNFTTRQSVYFDNANCTGASWMLDPANPVGGTVGEAANLYSLQGTAFAIGISGGDQNVLFRSAPGAAPATTPQSRWISERYSANCQPVADDPILRAALIPASIVYSMSTIYVPPYWSPAGLAGPPLSPATAPKKEGDPWL